MVSGGLLSHQTGLTLWRRDAGTLPWHVLKGKTKCTNTIPVQWLVGLNGSRDYRTHQHKQLWTTYEVTVSVLTQGERRGATIWEAVM